MIATGQMLGMVISFTQKKHTVYSEYSEYVCVCTIDIYVVFFHQNVEHLNDRILQTLQQNAEIQPLCCAVWYSAYSRRK